MLVLFAGLIKGSNRLSGFEMVAAIHMVDSGVKQSLKFAYSHLFSVSLQNIISHDCALKANDRRAVATYKLELTEYLAPGE